MAKGEYGATSAPKKAIQAMEVIYQASTQIGVVGNTVPTQQINDLTLKFDVTKGVQGEYDVALSAGMEPSKLTYTELSANLKWSKYNYAILDDAKLKSRTPKQIWKDATRSASEYFGAVKDFQCLTLLSAGASNTHTALGGNWDTDTGEIENDIVKAVQKIVAVSNVQPNETISVVYPADVSFELMKLDLIGNVQQQLKEYLQKSFTLDLRPYRASLDSDGNAYLDGLEDDCVVYVNGERTCKHAQFSPAEAARRDVPLVEHSRVLDRGEFYVQRMASNGRVVWDAIDSTETKTGRIYKILDVT